MLITHLFQSAVSDQPDASAVRPSDWNAAHVLLALTSDPVSPTERQVWVVVSGSSPTRVAALKIYDGATTHTIASVTY